MLSERSVDDQMELLNSLTDGHGAWVLRGETWHPYFTDICCIYINMFDPCMPTIIYDVCRGKFLVSAMGDWVAKNKKNYGIQ